VSQPHAVFALFEIVDFGVVTGGTIVVGRASDPLFAIGATVAIGTVHAGSRVHAMLPIIVDFRIAGMGRWRIRAG